MPGTRESASGGYWIKGQRAAPPRPMEARVSIRAETSVATLSVDVLRRRWVGRLWHVVRVTMAVTWWMPVVVFVFRGVQPVAFAVYVALVLVIIAVGMLLAALRGRFQTALLPTAISLSVEEGVTISARNVGSRTAHDAELLAWLVPVPGASGPPEGGEYARSAALATAGQPHFMHRLPSVRIGGETGSVRLQSMLNTAPHDRRGRLRHTPGAQHVRLVCDVEGTHHAVLARYQVARNPHTRSENHRLMVDPDDAGDRAADALVASDQRSQRLGHRVGRRQRQDLRARVLGRCYPIHRADRKVELRGARVGVREHHSAGLRCGVEQRVGLRPRVAAAVSEVDVLPGANRPPREALAVLPIGLTYCGRCIS